MKLSFSEETQFPAFSRVLWHPWLPCPLSLLLSTYCRLLVSLSLQPRLPRNRSPLLSQRCKIATSRPHKPPATIVLQDSCKLAQAFNPVFLDSTFGCRCLTLALATISTTTPVTPKSWESASPYSRGLYAISAAPLRVKRDFILASPALSLLQPFKCYTTPAIIYMNTVPNHGMQTES